MPKKHVNWSVVFLSSFMLIAFSSVTVSAKVRISERTKFYNVNGKTGAEIFRSISKRGPKTRRDGHAIATTGVNIRIDNVKTAVKRNRCVVTDADVILNLTYTLPRWRGKRRASLKVQKAWDKFAARVKKHEDTHGKISKDFARSLHRKILRLTGRVSKDCSDFGERSTRSLRRLERAHDRRHERFDRREGRLYSRIRRSQKALSVSN